ncbi:glycosyltransferase [Rhodopirellula halodulae]|uniref:glycosyltransferase n=1 Tax=Rhodopirellula halodulae TaxID=2894198 RepID=UPI001E40F2FF|nr:glycosyltransferase [Rhodopirellula sp. JC737]MCC9657818.1 glycosyltransferase [Rhodopirellula sp. JC737]
MTRVMLVARHFWPHCSGRHESAAAAMQLSQQWADWGMQVEVVTTRHGNGWPTEITLGNVKVHRIAAAPRGDWSTQRYIRHLGNWLVEQAPRLDAIVCHQVREECRAVANAIHSVGGDEHDVETISSGRGSLAARVPLGMAICGGWGEDSDERWCLDTRSGRRVLQACNSLDRVVTEHAKTDRFLVSHGVKADLLQRRPFGFERPKSVSDDQRLLARRSLQAINLDLATDFDSKVLLWCGPMTGRATSESGLGALVQSARFLAAREPDLRIWILGDGKLRDWAHSELRAEGVRSVVALPGSFSDMTEVWQASDAVVLNEDSQLRSAFPSALTAALPVIVARRSASEDYLNALFDETILQSLAWYDPAKPSTLRKAFRSIWEDMDAAKQHAMELAKDLAGRHPMDRELAFWRSLFQPGIDSTGPHSKAS